MRIAAGTEGIGRDSLEGVGRQVIAIGEGRNGIVSRLAEAVGGRSALRVFH
jgi:hypothetical protein